MNQSRSGLVIVVPVTRTRRALPSHVELDAASSGLAETSYAKGEDVKSVSVERLVRLLGRTPPGELRRLTEVLRTLLDVS